MRYIDIHIYRIRIVFSVNHLLMHHAVVKHRAGYFELLRPAMHICRGCVLVCECGCEWVGVCMCSCTQSSAGSQPLKLL